MCPKYTNNWLLLSYYLLVVCITAKTQRYSIDGLKTVMWPKTLLELELDIRAFSHSSTLVQYMSIGSNPCLTSQLALHSVVSLSLHSAPEQVSRVADAAVAASRYLAFFPVSRNFSGVCCWPLALVVSLKVVCTTTTTTSAICTKHFLYRQPIRAQIHENTIRQNSDE